MSLWQRRAIAVSALVGLCLAWAGSGCGRPSGPATLTVSSAWARATPPGAANGAAYLSVVSPTDDVITGVEVPASVARRAEMHSAMGGDDGGSMGNMAGMDHGGSGDTVVMKPLPAVDLPAGRRVTFEPGHRHIMLTDLRHGLDDGDAFDLTLRFRRAPDRTVRVQVATNPPGPG